MSINTNYSNAGWTSTILSSLTDLRASLDQQSLKLSTGLESTTYAGLGKRIGPVIDLHAKLNAINSYADMITAANSGVGLVSQSLTSMSKLIDTVLTGPLGLAGGTDKNARNSASQNVELQFSTLISYINTEGANGYNFGGDDQGNPPAKAASILLDGSAGRAGLRQLFSERFAADSGADGLGRLAVSAAGSTVSLNETTAGLPFGLKLSTIKSGLANSTVTQATGSPPSESITLSGQPSAGDQVTFNFTLPDGSTSAITLTAGTTSGPDQFVIGATAADTAQNMVTTLSASISKLVSTELKAASAIYTAKNFFASTATSPPERVSGTPASSATAVAPGTASDTVIWYQGRTDSSDPRKDRQVKIGDDITIDYGVRANEAGFQSSLAGLAASVLVMSNFSTTETVAAGQMETIRTRASQLTRDGQLGVQSVVASIAASQSMAKMIDDQNKAVKSLMQERLAGLENSNREETATQISSLTTQLQASYQVAAKLLNLSLASYL